MSADSAVGRNHKVCNQYELGINMVVIVTFEIYIRCKQLLIFYGVFIKIDNNEKKRSRRRNI